MSTLVLEMRAGDLMVVNGASIRFRTRTRVELVAKARFLFGKQVMVPEGANTPARRIYFACNAPMSGRRRSGRRRWPTRTAWCRVPGGDDLQHGAPAAGPRAALAEGDEWYQALRLVRHVMRHEATVLGLDPATGERLPAAAIASMRAATAAGVAAAG
jgi:flagellar protein FlbT